MCKVWRFPHLAMALLTPTRTLELAPTNGQEFPSFFVNDLSQNEPYSHLPYVTGPPCIKFYASVPLITKRRIPIGALIIIVQSARDGVSKDHIDYMGAMANSIIRHMD